MPDFADDEVPRVVVSTESEFLAPFRERWEKGIRIPGGMIPVTQEEMDTEVPKMLGAAPRVTLPDLDAPPEFVGTVKDFRGFGCAPAPRPAHPVFGDVPRGWVCFTVLDGRGCVSDPDARFVSKCFRSDNVVEYAEIHGRTETLVTVRINEHNYNGGVIAKESPAEVSRLIAEAQRG